MLNFDQLRAASIFDVPFRFIAAHDVITAKAAADIRQDYPSISKSGYLPLSKLECRGAFAALIEDLQSAQLARTLGDLLEIDLSDKPRMITVRKLSKYGDGRIHNDSEAKICTMLIYLNESWDAAAGGAIRALNGYEDMNDFAFETPPLAGHVFAFKRSANSWHGHPPFSGERYVVQTTFLISQEELNRKENRGGVQLFLKRINPFAR